MLHKRVIKSFRHKGLRQYWESGKTKGLNQAHIPRILRRLSALDVAESPRDIDLPGFRLHALKGQDKGRYSIWVTGNWRMTFEFDGIDVIILDLEDYH